MGRKGRPRKMNVKRRPQGGGIYYEEIDQRALIVQQRLKARLERELVQDIAGYPLGILYQQGNIVAKPVRSLFVVFILAVPQPARRSHAQQPPVSPAAATALEYIDTQITRL